jgi:cytosine/adenosine deaminase-related metal-dependent hydrolase
VKERISTVETRLRRKADGALARHGIAPHAPYSTSREIYQWSIRIATGLRLPLSTHAAETREEAEFLRTGQGEFREYLLRLGVSLDGWHPPGTGPIRYLADLGFLKACTQLVHCNYPLDNDIELLMGTNVVFCPRSQAYLGHTEHPYRKLLERGITVALGTDSLASNYSLSVLDEMKFVHSQDARPDLLLEMATIAGAKAMGMADTVGTLEPGKFADFCTICPPRGATRFEDIFSPDSTVRATAVGGTIVWRNHG